MAKERILTDQQNAFLEALFSDECKGNFKKAKEVAGFAENTTVAYILNTLQDEIIDRAKKMFVLASGEAYHGMRDVLKDGATLGAVNKLKAAQEILNRAGITSKEDSNQIKIPESGVVILPAKNMKIIVTSELAATENETDESDRLTNQE